ncbi:DUF6221 family protein [Streptomyces mirabilis]|uniref:DUF6221 family protein n=1 Tax=Streptomyces mirabilis TaxID=68239 RepID=UPI003685EF3D
MDDLMQWLDEQFDEDERIVREALRYTDPDWRLNDDGDVVLCPVMDSSDEGERRMLPVTSDVWRRSMIDGPGLVPHVAEHDPARVLREIDAKRQLVRELLEYEAQFDSDRGCGHDADYFASGLHSGHMPKDILGLRLLASGYSHRPGFREEWRP